MDRWHTEELVDDEVKRIAQLSADAMGFAQSVHLKPKHDDRFLDLVAAAYNAGKRAGAAGVIVFLTSGGPVH